MSVKVLSPLKERVNVTVVIIQPTIVNKVNSDSYFNTPTTASKHFLEMKDLKSDLLVVDT